MSETTPQEVPTRLLLESSNTTDTPQQTFRAGIERDRPFRIHAQTIGDVMYQVHEQLRLRGIRRTLPTLSISILWLMLELLDTEVLELENRMIVEVSQGYLHEQTGRAHTTQRTTGHISRALKALMEAGIVSVLVRGGGNAKAKYEISVPRTTGDLRERRSMSGRQCCASGGGLRAHARGPTKTITRACAGGYSAPAVGLTDVSPARQRAETPRAGATLGAYPISYSAAAAAALNTAAEGGPDSTRGASSEREQAAVKLLKDQGVEELDALDILSDPQINIADELICDVIKRITPDKPPANPGGWWRIALRRHQRYGPDPVVAKVEADKARQPERSLDYYDAQGRQLVERMSEGEVMEAHVILIEHYRRQGNTTAANTLEAVDDARSSPEFWRAVGKNQKVIGCELQLDGRES